MFGQNVSLGITGLNTLASLSLISMMSNPVTQGLAAVNTISSLASNIGNTFAGLHQAEVTPDQAKGNQANINSLVAQNKLGFYLVEKSIKGEYAKIIDDYFEQYGYKVNTLSNINFRTRQYWNYIETKDINIVANIPNSHLQTIKNMFNHGVTFWHDDNVGNYNRTNSIR